MEYWSDGVLGRPRIPALQYSSIPSLHFVFRSPLRLEARRDRRCSCRALRRRFACYVRRAAGPGDRHWTPHPIDQPAPLLDRDDEDARITILGRIRIVQIGLFAFAGGARGLSAGITVSGNKIAGDMAGALVHRHVDVLAVAAL